VRHRANIRAAEDNISTFDIELTLVLNGSILRVPVDTNPARAEAMRARRKARTIRRVLLRVCEAKGVEPMHPHLLRHACATHMLNNGATLVVIRELLGHAKLSTTAQYAFVSVALMQKTYNQAHPYAKP
jgi:site-specific recombinase XerC